MRPQHRILLAFTALAITATSLAQSGTEPGKPSVEQNRRLLDKWRADSEHWQRLQADLRAFQALSPDRQADLRQLDGQLHEGDADQQARLWRVLERYASWLERLHETDRKKVEGATDAKQRLAIITELRQREWFDRLPLAIREQINKAPAGKRDEYLTKLKQDERRKRLEWKPPLRPGDSLPKRLKVTDLQGLYPEARDWVNRQLLPMLTQDEKDRLTAAEGKWPGYLLTLVKLADEHPIALPGPSTGPAYFSQLSTSVKRALFVGPRPRDRETEQAALRKRTEGLDGKWPEYAAAVADFARQRKIDLPPFGPCKPDQFAPNVKAFILEDLIPALDEQDKAKLKAKEDKWPDYPRTVLELARKHELVVPGMYLPGPRKYWENFRGTARPNAE